MLTCIRATFAMAFMALSIAWMSATTLSVSDHVGQITLRGLPVPGATITATRLEQRFVTVSNPQGFYRFTGLADGIWMLRVEMLGFSPATRAVTVPSDVTTVWEIAIAPLQEIRHLAAVQPTEHNEIPAGSVARGSALATNLRFQRTKANPAPAARTLADEDDPGGGAETLEGRMSAEDGLLVNGSVNNGAASSFSQPPAFGNNRSGRRSQWNGGAGILLGDSAWDARPFSFTSGRTNRPDYTNWQLVGTFGGRARIPLVSRNRSTFFVAFQRTNDHNASTISAIVPSDLERRGDFSQSRNRLGQPALIHDPATGLPFPANVVPADRISPQAATLLRYYPRPNLDNDRFNYETVVPVVARRTNLQSRLTQVLNVRNQLSGTLRYQDDTSKIGNVFGFTDSREVAGLDATVNWVHRFARSLTLRLWYQYTRLSTGVNPYFAWRTNVSGEAGIGGNDQAPENWGPPMLRFSSGLAGLFSQQYALNQDRTHVWTAENVWSRGRHTLRFGGGARRLEFDLRSQQDARGTFSFTGAVTGSDLADFLLGIPQSGSIAFGNAEKHLRGSGFQAYFNDDYRLSPTFSINAGVRWDYEAPLTERYGRLVNLDLLPGFTDAAPVTPANPLGSLTRRRHPESLVHADFRGVQPRFGFASRPVPGSSLVVRGGYGIYRSTNVYRPIALLMAQQPPFSYVVNADNSGPNPVTFATGFHADDKSPLPTFAVDPDFRVGYAHNWQLLVQHDLPASMTWIASYQGTKGSRLMQETLPNTYPAGAVHPCQACPAGFVYLFSNGSSLRHAVQAQLRRRLRGGLSASVQYTLSKATDDAGALTGPALSGGAIAQDWLNVKAEYAPSNFDQRHLVTAQFEYTSGIGVAGEGLLTGWKGRVLGGWTLTSQLTTGSGLPLTPVYLTSVGGTGITGTIRASVTSRQGEPRGGGYFDSTAFAAPSPGQWGSARRNSLRGPAQFNVNSSIARTFKIRSRLNLEWRVDATNILNRVTYADVNVLVGGPQFGFPSRANPMRKLHTGLRLRF